MRELRANHDAIEGIVYAPASEWGPDDAYSLYRFFTHALYKAPKYDYYRRAIASLDMTACSVEARCIARAVAFDIPGSSSFFSRESQEALERRELPDAPIALSGHANGESRLSGFGVLL